MESVDAICTKCLQQRICFRYRFYEGKLSDTRVLVDGKEWQPMEGPRPCGQTSFKTTYTHMVPVNFDICKKCLTELQTDKNKDQMSPACAVAGIVILGFSGYFWFTPLLAFAGLGLVVLLIMLLSKSLPDTSTVREFLTNRDQHLDNGYALLTEEEYKRTTY